VAGAGQPARIDYDGVTGVIGRVASDHWKLRSSIGVPVSAEGRVWGVMVVAFTHVNLFAADAEERLAAFTELIATAVASTQTCTELRAFAEEQAALRRVATLVAHGAPPEDVLAAVAAEAGQLLAADVTGINRYDLHGSAATVGGWARTADDVPFPVGGSVRRGGRNVVTLVHETGRPARIDHATDGSGEAAAFARERGFRSVVGAPITVEDRQWGAIMVVSRSARPLPANTEQRLAGFAGLAANSIADAEARSALRSFTEEQAALGRVATLVARGAPPQEVFSAVTAEAGQLLQGDHTILSRYDPDGLVTVVGAWARTDHGRRPLIGLRFRPAGYGGCSSSRPSTSGRCQQIPKDDSPGSLSWPRPPWPRRERRPRSWLREPGSWPPPTGRAAGSSATCTTAPSSG
jgi:GAF domain-containing protein